MAWKTSPNTNIYIAPENADGSLPATPALQAHRYVALPVASMDVLPTDGAGNPTWDLAHYRNIFEKIRDCGRAAGLVCGADWDSPQTDWPHYEIRTV